MVVDREFLQRTVGHALLARIGPREGRLDAVRGVVGERQADGPCRGDGQQVRVAQAVLLDELLDRRRQARGEARAREIEVGVEERERAALARELDGTAIGGVAHGLGNRGGHAARFVAVVAQPQHDERVAQAGEAKTDAPLRHRFGALLHEWPRGRLEHVVEHAHRDFHRAGEVLEVEARALGEGVGDVAREVDRAEAAAAVRRQRLLRARVGGFDRLAVVEVVVAVDAVEEENPRLGVVVRRAHDLVPQVARAYFSIDPKPIAALVSLLAGPRLRLVHELERQILLHREHEFVGDAHRDVEVGEIARVLGVDEFLDVRVIAAQHPHLRAAPRARRLHRLAGAVEDAHVGHRPARPRARAFYFRAFRPDGGEVVAHAAAAAHGLRGFQ